MNAIEEFYPRLLQPMQVVITMHQKPDADAMGSSLGLQAMLEQLGHVVNVISPTNWPLFLNWLPGCSKVIDFEARRQKAEGVLQSADVIFCLDFNTLSRTKKMEPLLKASSAMRILIDHHQEPALEDFAFGKSDTLKSSTAEMVYDFIVDSGNEKLLSDEVAQNLYAGVMTDTGSFRFASTTASVHEMVAKLKRNGLNHHLIHENIYDSHLESRLRFFGFALLNRLEVNYELNTAVIAIQKGDLLKFDIKTGDTEGLVNYPLSLLGIKLAALVIDRDEERKWSFRSKGDVDVNTFARKYFEGGGHKNAAGGRSSETLEQTVATFNRVLPTLSHVLAESPEN